MYTSVLLVALSSVAAPSDRDSLTWQNDYAAARRQGESAGKPLAVFIGSGKAGWEKVCRDDMSSECKEALASKYVPCYIDVSTDEGRRLAPLFKVNGTGLVISDRTGELVAFRHEGDLSGGDLGRYLTRYADPSRAVSTTEGTGSARTSYYGPGDGTTTTQSYYGPTGYPQIMGGAPGYAPSYGGGFAPFYPSMGGGGCPGGRCGR
jgi:hypothetical protein